MSSMKEFGEDMKFINKTHKERLMDQFEKDLPMLRDRLAAVCPAYVLNPHNDRRHWTVVDTSRQVTVANLWPSTQKWRISMSGEWMTTGIRTNYGDTEGFLMDVQRHFSNFRRRG